MLVYDSIGISKQLQLACYVGIIHKVRTSSGERRVIMAKEVLYIGIDLGTFRSVMVSSDSHEEEELTVIGTPKDPIARNFLKRDVRS